jgi:hypothetical protein
MTGQREIRSVISQSVRKKVSAYCVRRLPKIFLGRRGRFAPTPLQKRVAAPAASTMGFFHSTRASTLKTTHFAAVWFDNQSHPLTSEKVVDWEIYYNFVCGLWMIFVVEPLKKSGYKICNFEYRRFCGVKKFHFILDTLILCVASKTHFYFGEWKNAGPPWKKI